jgi:hypothetical protein
VGVILDVKNKEIQYLTPLLFKDPYEKMIVKICERIEMIKSLNDFLDSMEREYRMFEDESREE